jgi:hypothetical protein
MEHGQIGEGEIPQHLFFGASIEEIDNNATMYQVWWWFFVYKVHPVMLQWVQFLLFLSVQHDMHGGSASVGAQDYHFIADESVLPSSISGKKQAREKKSCS